MTTETPGPGAALDPAELRDLIATDADPDADEEADEEADASEEALEALNKRELFTRVKARTQGVKGREIRLVIDAVLDELGAALAAGEALKLPPLGTLKVQRHKSLADGDLLICKLRRKKPRPEAKDPLAEPAEDR